MKFVLLCVCFIALASAGIDEKHIEMAKLLLKECQAVEGGTDSDFDMLMSGKFPQNTAAYCMITCVNEKIGIFKGGKIDAEGFMETARMVVKGDEKLMALAKELLDECNAEVDGTGDRCDMGMKLEACMHKGMLARKLDLDLI